jgi:hypothetical protein
MIRSEDSRVFVPDNEILLVLSSDEAAALRDVLLRGLEHATTLKRSDVAGVYGACLFINDALPDALRVHIPAVQELTSNLNAAAA